MCFSGLVCLWLLCAYRARAWFTNFLFLELLCACLFGGLRLGIFLWTFLAWASVFCISFLLLTPLFSGLLACLC